MTDKEPSMPSYLSRRWDLQGATEQDDSYQSVCPSAIAACILAALCPLAFFHPLLWTLPVCTLAVVVWAAIAISRQPKELLGRRAVQIALLTAVFFGTAAVTEWFGYRSMIQNEGRQFVDSWFDLMKQGRPLEAYQLQSHPLNRRLPGRGLEAQYSVGGKSREEFDAFMEREVPKTLSDPDLHADYQFKRVVGFTDNPYREVVSLEYELSWDTFNGRKTQLVLIIASRLKLIDVPLAGWMLNSI